MKELNAITPLGKGDALMCFGIFVELAKQYDHINYYVNSSVYADVAKLYLSITNLTVVAKSFDELIVMSKDPSFFVIGFKEKPTPETDEFAWWYETLGIDPNKRWSNFYFQRDIEREKDVFYNIIGLKDDEEYIFIHEDEDRSFVIADKYLDPNVKIISAIWFHAQHLSIFDYIYTLEHAKEVHCIHSVILALIDLMDIKCKKLYFHNVYDHFFKTRHKVAPTVKLKSNWNIIYYKDLSMTPTRTDIINLLFEKYGFTSYLEIGVNDPDVNFDKIKSLTRVGVEPFPVKKHALVYDSASDEFFELLPPEKLFDVIFIDGLHTSEQSYRDAINAKKHLSENGFIVMHDCNPLEKVWTIPVEEYVNGLWTGSVYKAFIRLKSENKDWSCFVINEDMGCGILTPRPILKNKRLMYGFGSSLSWEDFNKNRTELLQLIDYDDYVNILK